MKERGNENDGMCCVLAAIVCTASADIMLEVVPVDNSGELTGWVTQDLVITTDTDWLRAQELAAPRADEGTQSVLQERL